MRKRQLKSQGFKLEFHRTYLLVALSFILTGYYLNLIVFTSLIIVHELGHYLVAKANNFKVEKIIIYPYGGLTKINDLVNRDIAEELLIATSGIIFQYIFYILITIFNKYDLIRDYTHNLYTLYNNQMIFFNLLPIYPLDGGKIIGLILNKYLPYTKSNLLTIIISILSIILISILNLYQTNYSNLMIMFLLLTYIYKFYKNQKYLYNRFLLERYLYNIEYPKKKIIKNIKNMFKNKTHLINISDTYIEEKIYLTKIFTKK